MTLFEILGSIIIDQKGALKSLDDVEKAADKSSGNMNKSFTKVGGLLKGALVGGAAAAASAVAAFGLTALKSAGDVEVGIDRMAAKLGITADEAKGLGEVAKSVFKDSFGGSLGEAVSMVETLRQKLGAMSDEETKRYTEMAATISDLYGADYAQTVGNAQTLMDNFGLSANQAFDFITTGYQKGLDASGDFSASIGEYATQFANGGATADQFFGVLESGMQNGVLGTDKAADAFKEFRLRIQDGSKLTSESLKQIGIDSDEMARQISSGQITAADAFQTVITKLGETEDPMIRMQAGAGLIGSQFEDLGDTAVQQLSLTTTSLDDMAGATDRAGQAAYDNLGGKMTTLWRTLRTEAITALEPLIPYLSQFTDILIDKAPLMIDAGQQVASFFQTWGPSIGTIVQEVSTVVSDSFTAMSLLWTNVLKPSWDAIEPFVTGLFEAMGSTIKGFKLLLEGDFVGAAQTAWDGFKAAFTGLSQTVVNVVTGIWGLIKQPLTKLKDDFVKKATEVKDGFVKPIQELPNTIKGYIDDIWTNVKGSVEGLVENVVSSLMGIPDQIKNLGSDIVDGLTGGITDNLSRAKDSVQGFAGNVGGWFKDTLGIKSPSRVFAEFGKNILQGLGVGLNDASENSGLQTSSADLGRRITTSFLTALGITQPENDWVLAGRNVIQGFLDGMKSQWPQVESFLQRVRDARPDVNVPMPNASASVTGSVGVQMPDASAAVTHFVSVIMPQVSAAFNRFVVSDAPRFSAASEHMYSSVLQNAQNESEARRIMLDTQIAQQNAQAVMWQTTLNNIGLGLTNTVGWIGTTLGNTVSWIGTSLTGATNWLGGMLTFSGQAWGQTAAWVGNVFTSVAGYMGDVMAGLGTSLLNLAGSQIPWLGASMDAMAGGPVAVLIAFLTSLIGETWQFQEVITRAKTMVEPLIAILGDLISAIWPVIQILLNNLKVAFEYIGFVVKNVVTPVFSAAAKIIASVYNALVRAINWALGWLGVHLNEVNPNAAPVNSGMIGDIFKKVQQNYGQGRNAGLPSGIASAVGKAIGKIPAAKTPSYKAPSTPKSSYNAPKQSKAKTPSYSAPKAPGDGKGPSMGKAPGGSKTPGMSKTPGYSGGKSSGSYSGGSGSYDSSSDLSRGSGGTKVSEITGPTRDFLADVFASFAALPTLVGIQSRTYDLLSQKLGNVPVIAGAAFAGGPTITIENVNLSASGNLDYDVNQFVDEIEAKLFRRFTTGKRGTGR